MAEKTIKKQKLDKKVLTFFMIAFPTLLIIAIGMLAPEAWWVTILLAFYQFILLKQFLDNYYDIMD